MALKEEWMTLTPASREPTAGDALALSFLGGSPPTCATPKDYPFPV